MKIIDRIYKDNEIEFLIDEMTKDEIIQEKCVEEFGIEEPNCDLMDCKECWNREVKE